MNTQEIIKEVRKSKGPGIYRTTSYYNSTVPYSYNPGNNNGTSGMNPSFVSDDSFLKNLHIKNNQTIKGNNNFFSTNPVKIKNIEGHFINNTRSLKSCNDVNEKDYFNLGFRTNNSIKKVHVNFETRVGVDSRHIKR